MSQNLESMVYRSSPRNVKSAFRTILLAIVFGGFFFVLIPLMHSMQKPEPKDLEVRTLPAVITLEKPEEIYELPAEPKPVQETSDEVLEEIPPPIAAPPAVPIQLDMISSTSAINFEPSEVAIELDFEVEKIVTTQPLEVDKTKSLVKAPQVNFANQIFSENQVDVLPKKLSGSRPIYPRRALQRNITGSVNIECVISATGEILNPRVIGGEEYKYFEASCLKSLKKWTFAPAKKNGQAVACRLIVPYQFGIRK